MFQDLTFSVVNFYAKKDFYILYICIQTEIYKRRDFLL